jgi:hypothetical protein
MQRSAFFLTMLVLLAVAVLLRIMYAAEPEVREYPRAADAAEAKITEALRRGNELDAAQRTEIFRRTAREVLDMKPNNTSVQRILEPALTEVANAPRSPLATTQLEMALSEALDTLAFRPLIEAPLPNGFPQPTALGEIEIKTYPAYRMARTTMNGEADQRLAFFKLFGHITLNQIAMTAPVELTYAAGEREQINQRSMAFLYENQEIGNPIQAGPITVSDVAPMTVVSLGVRGDYSRDRVVEGEKQLRAWLDQNGEYEVAGNLRLLGYNSPMVPVERRFAELQFPVKKLSTN